MAATDVIKRAPRWAWWVTGGVGLGAIALKIYGDRDKPPDEQTAVGEDVLYAGGVGSASPAFGVVTPTVVPVSDSADPSGLLDSMIGGIDTLLDATGTFWRDVWGPVQAQNENLLTAIYGQNAGLLDILQQQLGTQSETISAIAQAGAAPTSAPPPPPISSPPPPPPPAPVARPPAYVDQFISRTRDNGQRGGARRVWCNCINVHRYPDGRAAVTREKKIHDGQCLVDNAPCPAF